MKNSLQPFIFLIEDISDAVCITSPEGTAEFINSSFKELSNYKSIEELNRNGGLAGILGEKIVQTTFKDISTRNEREEKILFKTKNRGSISVNVRIKLLTDHNGSVIGAAFFFKEVSIKKHPEEYLRLLESFVENANDAVMITEAEPIDEPGPRIVYINPAFTQITGYAQEEITWQSPRKLQGPDTNRDELNKVRKALEAKSKTTVEVINYAKDGKEFWVELSIVPVQDNNGRVTHFVSVQRETTHRKQTEKILLENHRELQKALQTNREIFEHSLDIICVLDEEGKFVHVSQASERIWGYTPEELIGQPFTAFVYPEDREKAIAMAEKLISGSTTHDFESRYVHKNGRLVPMMCTASWSADNKFIYAISRDITERKAAEEKIKQSEQLYRSLSQNYPNGTITFFDKNFKIVVMEGKELAHFYVTPDMLAGKSIYEVFNVQTADYIKEKLMPTFEGKSLSLELHIDNRYYLCTTVPLPENGLINRIMVVTQNITARKEAEQKLHESEQHYKSLFEYHPDAVFSLDLEGNFTSGNNALAKLLEVPLEKVLTKKFIPFIAPEDMEITLQKYKEAFEGHPTNYELAMITASGKRLDINVTNIPIIVNNEIKGIYAIAKDVTLTKKANKLVEESAQRLNNMLESIGDAFFALDKNFNVTYWNKMAERILSVRREEILGKNLWEIFPEAVTMKYYNEYRRAMDENIPVHFEEYHLPKQIWTEVNAYPSEEGLSVYFRDITERKRTEENLQNYNVQLEKINHELDQFVYRASHDLRAPLVSVLGLIRLSFMEKDEAQKNQYLSLMEKSVHRLDNFIQDIIYYSKNSRTDLLLSKVNFKALIADTLSDLKFMEEAKSIDFRTDIEEINEFYTDENRLNVVLHNIIANAIRYHEPSKQQYIHIRVSRTGKEQARIVVEDNGQGIAKEHQPRIFEMFYRATQKNVGTGLGLYIVKENLNKLKGTIEVDSEPGRGTTFSIQIPNLYTNEKA